MRGGVYKWTALGVMVLLPLVALWVGEPIMVSIATRILIMGIAAISIDVLVGYAGLASLGHAMFFGLGGYMAVFMNTYDGSPFWSWAGSEILLSWPLAMCVLALVAILFGYLCLRARGFQFIMITLAFAQLFYFVFAATPEFGGDEGFRMDNRQLLAGVSLNDPLLFYYTCLLLAVLVLAFGYRLANSHFGMVLSGCRQNERRLSFLGVRTQRYLLCAFVLSAVVTGIAGMLLANYNRFINPDSLSWIQSGDFLIMILIGGVGTMHGGLIGAAVFILLEYLLLGWVEDWQMYLGVLLLLLVLFARGGVSGWFAGGVKRND